MRINPRIFGAFLVGAGLISVAYFLAPTPQEPRPSADASANVVAGPAPKREPIRVLDSDNDGIADWQEQFRRTEPVAVSKEELNAKEEGYTPPDTLTGKLAIELFKGTVESEIRGPFGSSQEDLLQLAAREIEDAASDEPFTRVDITIVDENSPERLRVYGNRIADINLSSTVPEGSRDELEIVENALRTDDERVLAELDPRIKAYEQLVADTRAVAVPSVVVDEHLALLNAYYSLQQDLMGMRQAFADPLYTMTRLKRYYNDAIVLNGATVELYTKLANAGAGFVSGDRALDLVQITEE